VSELLMDECPRVGRAHAGKPPKQWQPISQSARVTDAEKESRARRNRQRRCVSASAFFSFWGGSVSLGLAILFLLQMGSSLLLFIIAFFSPQVNGDAHDAGVQGRMPPVVSFRDVNLPTRHTLHGGK
jgi:hypothetical protein